MELNTPTPFVEALASLSRRRVLPTHLTTAEINRMGDKFRRESFFSAQTLLEDLLENYKADVESILNPTRSPSPRPSPPGEGDRPVTEGLNIAKARERAKEVLASLGYQPDPDKRGTLQDLSSDRRINLVLETNAAVAQGEGWWLQGQDPAVLDAWPAQELYRAEGREKNRDWAARWRIAGQASGSAMGWTMDDGRMVALKNHPIWGRLGDGSLFADGLGNPWPPFAFGSGMDVRDVTRGEAVRLGLLEAGERVQSQGVMV